MSSEGGSGGDKKGRNISGWCLFYLNCIDRLKKGGAQLNCLNIPEGSKKAANEWNSMSKAEKDVYNTKASKLRQQAVDGQPKKPKKKKVPVPLRTKCSSLMVASTLNKIKGDERKCKIIKYMGFKSLLSIQCKTTEGVRSRVDISI